MRVQASVQMNVEWLVSYTVITHSSFIILLILNYSLILPLNQSINQLLIFSQDICNNETFDSRLRAKSR